MADFLHAAGGRRAGTATTIPLFGRGRSTAAADFPTLQRSLCAQALSLARADGGHAWASLGVFSLVMGNVVSVVETSASHYTKVFE